MMLQKVCILALIGVVFVQAHSSNNDDSYMHPGVFRSGSSESTRAVDCPVEEPEFWRTEAQNDLSNRLNMQQQIGQAKNIIMFLGDGFGVPTVTAARILKGQAVDNVPCGEEGALHMDTFTHTGMSRTFCTDAQTADSACSATAYLCGVKANTGTMGVNSNVLRRNCTLQNNQADHVSSILAWAQAAGKSTGVVTTTRITHASPGGTYAHIANRDWESDVDISNDALADADPADCDDIAEQLILNDPGKSINVILGGGRRKFLPDNVTDAEGINGQRKDGTNLVEQWQTNKPANVNATYVQKVGELKSVDASKTDYLLGLFSDDHLAYYGRQAENEDPTLTDMTEKAIEILSKNPNGFFLFVEGGLIDWAHHANEALKAVWEAVEFDRAIQKGDEMTNDDDTLIVVTADHSHAFTFNGYAPRGSSITAFGGLADDNIMSSVMNYANGPGYKPFLNNTRHNITEDDITDIDYKQVVLVPMSSETHGGEDVMIFAKGPFSHLFAGVHLQSYIPHAMAYAACIGNGQTYCTITRENEGSSGSPSVSISCPLIFFIMVLYSYRTWQRSTC